MQNTGTTLQHLIYWNWIIYDEFCLLRTQIQDTMGMSITKYRPKSKYSVKDYLLQVGSSPELSQTVSIW